MSKIKKILAVVLTLAMVLAMSVTAFAEKNGASIKVTGLSTEGTQEVKVYLIYKLDSNDNNWVLSDWAKNVTGIEEEKLNDSNVIAGMVRAASADDVTADESATSSNGTVTIEGLQAGAYLVIADDTLNKTTYNAMVAVTYKYDDDNNLIAPNQAEVVAKASGYSVNKALSHSENDTVVEVGDLVQYTITTTVPYITKDNASKGFTITDTVTGAKHFLTGTTAKDDLAVWKVEINGVEQTITAPYVTDSATGSEFTVDLSNYVSTANTYAGQKVVITYTVQISAVNSISNTASSNHVTNATNNVVAICTGNAQITKYGDIDKSIKLAGAQFALYREKEDGSKEYATIDENGYVTGIWSSASNDTAILQCGTVTTNDDGLAIVYGLDEGTYYFDEIVAPDGYSVNSNDSSVTVNKNTDNSASGATDMIDSKLSTLPSTGGIGTTIFTVVGCLIMIAAAAMFFVSRRRTEK
jgi:LPXTG-motif cell wall-anchored protein